MRKLNAEAKLEAIRKLCGADPFTAPSMKDVTPKILAILDAPEPKPKQPSRIDRWNNAASALSAAANDLLAVQEEYQEWRDNLPENLSSGTLAEKLDEVTALDVQSAVDLGEEAEGLDLPRGFGKD